MLYIIFINKNIYYIYIQYIYTRTNMIPYIQIRIYINAHVYVHMNIYIYTYILHVGSPLLQSPSQSFIEVPRCIAGGKNEKVPANVQHVLQPGYMQASLQ